MKIADSFMQMYNCMQMATILENVDLFEFKSKDT